MAYCKVIHPAVNNGCRFSGRERLVVRTSSTSGTASSAIELTPSHCPACGTAFQIAPKRTITKSLPGGFNEVTVGLGHAAGSRKRGRPDTRPTYVHDAGGWEETSDVDPEDLDYLEGGNKRVSLDSRLTRSDYEHTGTGSLGDAQDAGKPRELKEFAYGGFRRSAKVETHRNQAGAIKAHYENRAVGATVPQPTTPASAGNPHVRIALDAGYRATQIVKHYDNAEKADFEWCHVQADSLGGLNCRQNLFCGSSACNTFMLALEDIVRVNDDVEVEVATYYEPKVDRDGEPNLSRGSSRLAPAFVRYSLTRKTKTASWLISARCHYFSRSDREAVFKHAKDTLKVKLPEA